MLTRPSFFPLNVQPSASRKTSLRDVAHGALPDWPGSRCLMNQQFSAKRHASRMKGMPCSWRIAATCRTFSRLAGCPPPVLFVIVIIPSGILPRCSRQQASRRSRSMLPLKGCSDSGSRPSRMTRSSAVPSSNSMFARVVSKWQFDGIAEPCFTVSAKRMRSAARPWCVGMMNRYPVRSRTACSNLKNEREPAYDSSAIIIAAHWLHRHRRRCPESVRKSNVTASAGTRNRLKSAVAQVTRWRCSRGRAARAARRP